MFSSSFWRSLVSATTGSGKGEGHIGENNMDLDDRVSGDKTDGSPAAQFAAFTTPVGLERDMRNVQEVKSLSLSLSCILPIKINDL